MTIYEKLCIARDKVMEEDWDYVSKSIKMEILTRLIEEAFLNKENPDKLPKTFTINNIFCTNTEYIKKMVEEFGIEVESVEFFRKDSFLHNSFFVKVT